MACTFILWQHFNGFAIILGHMAAVGTQKLTYEHSHIIHILSRSRTEQHTQCSYIITRQLYNSQKSNR